MMQNWALSPQVLAFIQRLRAEGLPIGSGETQDALRALACVPLTQPLSFRLALRETLAKSLEEQVVFDRIYAEFWRIREPEPAQVSEKNGETGDAVKPLPGAAGATDIPTSGAINNAPDDDRSSGASGQPRLMQRDFSDIDGAELQEMQALITLIGKQLASRAGRRWQRAPNGPADLRASMRAALAKGGELLEIKYRKRRPQKLNLVVLADVSHSMDAYSRFFLQFIYAFQGLFKRMETFVFSTQLSQVTHALRRGQLDVALAALPDAVADWAGGTRIGESLHTFLREHGDALLNKHTVVMVVSDGWDTGKADDLDNALRALRLRCRQILWLNPLQDHPRYFASAAGAHTNSRWIDHCLPARDLHSLKALAQQLQKLKLTA